MRLASRGGKAPRWPCTPASCRRTCRGISVQGIDAAEAGVSQTGRAGGISKQSPRDDVAFTKMAAGTARAGAEGHGREIYIDADRTLRICGTLSPWERTARCASRSKRRGGCPRRRTAEALILRLRFSRDIKLGGVRREGRRTRRRATHPPRGGRCDVAGAARIGRVVSNRSLTQGAARGSVAGDARDTERPVSNGQAAGLAADVLCLIVALFDKTHRYKFTARSGRRGAA